MEHHPVLLKETVDFLSIQPNGCYVDGTVGGGGHAAVILQKMNEEGIYIAIDRDLETLERAKSNLKEFKSKIFYIHGVFSEVVSILEKLKISQIDGILLDLGVSSFQLDDPSRGFSFLNEGPLDMRMDPSLDETAADLVNQTSEEELKKIFREFGEEKFAGRIARSIRMKREESPFSNTKELADLIAKSVPFSKKSKIHPATRVFQALRIAVNQELKHLSSFLDLNFQFLKVGGRVAIISFHSLEDRLVKWGFRSSEQFKILTKKPIIPSEEEQKLNPRARSAKLRVVERK